MALMFVVASVTGARADGASDGLAWGTNLYAAYDEALRTHKPMVVFFYFKGSKYCQQLESQALASREINALGGAAVFVKVDIQSDDAHQNVSHLVSQLGLDQYPVTSVLDVGEKAIAERGRVTGYYASSEYYFQLSRLLISPARSTDPKQ
jgi:hypothetical protein